MDRGLKGVEVGDTLKKMLEKVKVNPELNRKDKLMEIVDLSKI